MKVMKSGRFPVVLLVMVLAFLLADILLYKSVREATPAPTGHISKGPAEANVSYDAAVPPYACPLLLESYDPNKIKDIFKSKKAPQPVYTGYCLTVPVLMYHHVQPQSQAVSKGQTSVSMDSTIFEGQMAYIASHGYTTITAKQLIDALRTKTALPPKSIVITLDDGYKDAYEYAFQSLSRYHLVANLMIPTGLLEGPDYLTWGQLTQMKSSGLIYLTDHTWSHYSVGGTNGDKIRNEIETGRSQLESRTGQIVDVFTYPYGTFGNTAISILQQDGFIGAYSTISGMVQCDSFIMTLHRTRIGNAPLFSYGL